MTTWEKGSLHYSSFVRGISRSPTVSPHKRPVIRRFRVFLAVSLNKLLSCSLSYSCCVAGPCITTAIWRCRNPFSEWQHSFQWKLQCHWLKGLRQHHVAAVIQDTGDLSRHDAHHSCDITVMSFCPSKHRKHKCTCLSLTRNGNVLSMKFSSLVAMAELCHFNNLRCSLWRKFHQNDSISFSLLPNNLRWRQ